MILSAGIRFVSYGDLVKNLQSYVDGYASQQRFSAPVTIAIATNNDIDVYHASGVSFANHVIDPVQSYARRYPGITIAGSDDMEPGFRAGYSATKSWLQGYLSATSAPFVFTGSADGCAWSYTGGSCNNGWTMSDLYYLTGGAYPIRMINLPQIYNTTMAAQWRYISLTGVRARHPRINFGGALTEWTACRQARSCGSLTGNIGVACDVVTAARRAGVATEQPAVLDRPADRQLRPWPLAAGLVAVALTAAACTSSVGGSGSSTPVSSPPASSVRRRRPSRRRPR